MAHSSIRLKARRRKVANLAAYSRQRSVRNCTIPKADKEEIIDIKVPWSKEPIKGTKWHAYKMPDEGYPQPKNLRKRTRGTKWVRNKTEENSFKVDFCVPEKYDYKSEFPDAHAHEKMLWKNLGKAAKMKAYEDEKMKKWERKHPKPCPTDDLFKDEYIPLWEKEREEALIRIRDFVVSMFDKLPLTGRYKTGEHKFEEKQIAEIKDINGEGHKVNELKKDSKLLKHAQKKVNEASAKSEKFVAGNLRDHKRKKGRIILPERRAA